MAVFEIRHPLVKHKLGLLRERDISTKDFRELASEVGMLLAYEATRNLPSEKVTIDTWGGQTEVDRIKGKKITIVPILRAGAGDDGRGAQGRAQCQGLGGRAVSGRANVAAGDLF